MKDKKTRLIPVFFLFYFIVYLPNRSRQRYAKRNKWCERRKPKRPTRRADRPPPLIPGYNRYEVRNPYLARNHKQNDYEDNDIRFISQSLKQPFDEVFNLRPQFTKHTHYKQGVFLFRLL